MWLLKNKRAERLFSFIWILILAVVGVGIISGIVIVFGAEADMRQIESDSLYSRIVECIIPDYLNPNVFEADFNVLGECNFNPAVIREGGDIYFEIKFLNKEGVEFREIILGGEPALKEEYMLSQAVEKAEDFARGVEGEKGFYYYDGNNELKEGKAKVLVATNLEGKRVSEDE